MGRLPPIFLSYLHQEKNRNFFKEVAVFKKNFSQLPYNHRSLAVPIELPKFLPFGRNEFIDYLDKDTSQKSEPARAFISLGSFYLLTFWMMGRSWSLLAERNWK